MASRHAKNIGALLRRSSEHFIAWHGSRVAYLPALHRAAALCKHMAKRRRRGSPHQQHGLAATRAALCAALMHIVASYRRVGGEIAQSTPPLACEISSAAAMARCCTVAYLSVRYPGDSFQAEKAENM